MSYSYQIDHARQWVIVERSGVLTRESILDSMKDIRHDPGFDATYDTLADFSEITEADLDLEDIQNLIFQIASEAGSSGRVAMVIGYSPQWWTLGEYFTKAAASHDMPEHQAFRSREEAELWLRGAQV